MINTFYIKSNNDNNLMIDRFILVFYFSYLIISYIGSFFIDYEIFSLNTLLLYFIYIFSLYIGISLSKGTKPLKIHKRSISSVNYMILKIIFIVFLTIIIVSIWRIYLNHYGSFSYIVNHAYDIRHEYIGKGIDLIPVYLSYSISIVYAIFCMILAEIGTEKRNKWFSMLLLVLLFVIIALNDLTTFGRVGILFSIFSIAGFFLVFNKKIFSIRNIISTIVLFFALSFPRLLRGGFDNFEGTVKDFKAYLLVEIPEAFNSVISIFVYYFSSLFALSKAIETPMELTYGKRLFAPVFNIISRITGDSDRFSLIEPHIEIPFDFNIFSIIKDIVNDFGFIGLIFVPLLFGLLIGWIFKSENTIFNNALKIFIISWLFFTPLFNILSFGGFLISFIFLLGISILFNNIKAKNNAASRY